MVYVFALLSIALGAFAQLLLKLSVQGESALMSVQGITRIVSDYRFLAGTACYGLSLLFWLKVLSELELSKAYPMVSLGYVFTFILGWLILDEPLRLLRVIGLVVIIIGVILISRS
ncbi:MAG: EamA family transporter [Muribaculaceae bacterium]|nr:EamA family transporter [Muribaculaceae bacterium]